jgi:hypothetical protein
MNIKEFFKKLWNKQPDMRQMYIVTLKVRFPDKYIFLKIHVRADRRADAIRNAKRIAASKIKLEEYQVWRAR